MAKCCICGTKFSWLRAKHDLAMMYSNDVIEDLKKAGAYTEKKMLLADSFCEKCRHHLSNIYKAQKGWEDYFKNGINAYNYLNEKIEQNQIHINFDADGFELLLYSYYKRIINCQNNMELIQKIKKKINERWDCISVKYANLVFPKNEKHHHICATRYNDNLVLIENKSPKVKMEITDEEKQSENIFNLFNRANDEALFAISIIPLENIVSYQLIGDVEHVAMVSGGGGYGGEPSLTGATIGGLLFGDAGAIIGAQTGFCINPIESTIKEFDSRVTILNLKNAEGQVEIRELPYYYSEVFMKVIPEKEFNYLQATKNAETTIHTQSAPATNMVEEMKQLKELLDLNLISQEEYDLKRQQILNL